MINDRVVIFLEFSDALKLLSFELAAGAQRRSALGNDALLLKALDNGRVDAPQLHALNGLSLFCFDTCVHRVLLSHVRKKAAGSAAFCFKA